MQASVVCKIQLERTQKMILYKEMADSLIFSFIWIMWLKQS